MPIYRAGKNRWRVTIFHEGHRRDWIVRGQKSDAEDWEARQRVELAKLAPGGEYRSAPTFSDFSRVQYAAHAETHLAPRTWSNRTYQLETLRAHFGEMPLNTIGSATIEDFKARRLADGVKAPTVNSDLKVLRAILSYAASVGVPLALPSFRSLPERGLRRRNAHAWTAEEVERLYAATRTSSPTLLPVVVFLANTGCRKGEAIALTWDHVDLTRRLVRIWPSDEWQPKSGKPREVPLNDALVAILEPAERVCRYVFPARGVVDGRRAWVRFAYWPQRRFDEAREAAGLEGGPHVLRHTYATHFLARYPNLHALARILGHSTSYVTELYGHLLPDQFEQARTAVSFPLPLAASPLARGATKPGKHDR